MVKRSNKIQKKKTFGIIIVIIVVAILSAGTSYVYNYVKHFNNLFYPGVKVENIDLSGKNMDEAKKLIKGRYVDKLSSKEIIVKADEQQFSIDLSKLNGKYDLDKALKDAYAYGKDNNLFIKYVKISRGKENIIKLPLAYDKNKLKEFIKNIKEKVDTEPVNAKLVKEGNGFSFKNEKCGKRLDEKVLEESIVKDIVNCNDKEIVVKAKINKIKPKISSEKLKPINAMVSSFSTNYGGISSFNRGNNIEVATNSINGTILMPGESFSFNDTVGERTTERGYKSAGVIIGNKVDSGLGGGICQVSSTLYNAILLANIKATERTHHTLPSSYVPLGRDATVDWGNIDYKFKNTLPYPIYIEGYASGGTLGFNIYSNSSLKSKTYDIYNEVYERIPATCTKVNDDSLPAGQEEVTQGAYEGLKVRVYENCYENGKLVSNQLISDDFYRPVEGIIKVGTKKPEEKKPEPQKVEPKKIEPKKAENKKIEVKRTHSQKIKTKKVGTKK